MSLVVKIGFNVFRGYAQSLYQFIILVCAIKVFGPDYWGEIVSIFLITNLLSMIAQFGQKEFLLRAFSQTPAEIAMLFSQNFVSRSILLLLVVLFFLVYPTNIAWSLTLLVFVQYLYLSLDCLVIYFQKFKAQFLAESTSFCVLLIGFLVLRKFDLQSVIIIYVIAFSMRFLVLALYVRPFSFLRHAPFSWKILQQGFPFFLLAFSGWLAARLDTYFVNYYLSKTDLTAYQFLISGLLLIQGLSYFISAPLYKYYFRLNDISSAVVSKKFIAFALPLAILAFLALVLFERLIFAFDFSNWSYLWAFLFIVPTFFYTFDVLRLFKSNKEYTVVGINGLMIVFQAVLFLVLIPRLAINGALITICVTQWLTLFIYKRFNSKSI